ncbi:hypothetical protein CDL12_17952 [Handroanthus impetiginosus]|uniref:Uncharacterized protein n=1 Tax=Handroanthus impetiginosus TaxID=429701 RepID=A0A2G9GW00_9LAMI|nr:hypothetical protein CDL12_17952 [Handroanthus impetiginosus]
MKIRKFLLVAAILAVIVATSVAVQGGAAGGGRSGGGGGQGSSRGVTGLGGRGGGRGYRHRSAASPTASSIFAWCPRHSSQFCFLENLLFIFFTYSLI